MSFLLPFLKPRKHFSVLPVLASYSCENQWKVFGVSERDSFNIFLIIHAGEMFNNIWAIRTFIYSVLFHNTAICIHIYQYISC